MILNNKHNIIDTKNIHDKIKVITNPTSDHNFVKVEMQILKPESQLITIEKTEKQKNKNTKLTIPKTKTQKEKYAEDIERIWYKKTTDPTLTETRKFIENTIEKAELCKCNNGNHMKIITNYYIQLENTIIQAATKLNKSKYKHKRQKSIKTNP